MIFLDPQRIRKLPETLIYLTSKYSAIIGDETCSLHVRRGDYLPKSNFHPIQTIDYYKEAISIIGEDKLFLIFSDDIDWCVNNLDFIKIGILAGICLLTRQYLGILMPIGILYIFLNSNLNIHKKTKNSIVIFLSFSLTLTPWFLRNYINWGRPIVLMGETTGYQAFQEDYIAFDKLYSLIYVDVTPIFQSVALVGKDTITNSNVLGSLSDELRELNEMAFKCGPSFNARRYNILYKKDNILRKRG